MDCGTERAELGRIRFRDGKRQRAFSLGILKRAGVPIPAMIRGPPGSPTRLFHWRYRSQMLEKVLFNLLQNAIRFVASGVAPLTRVWPERRGCRLRVWIEDNGIGIRPEFQEVIFRPFETLHPSHVFGGNGMGLAVVKEGVYQMGGEVGVEASPSGGSWFWLELRTIPPEPTATAKVPSGKLRPGLGHCENAAGRSSFSRELRHCASSQTKGSDLAVRKTNG